MCIRDRCLAWVWVWWLGTPPSLILLAGPLRRGCSQICRAALRTGNVATTEISARPGECHSRPRGWGQE
eukprot:1510128-Prorocentrum_lima.AAC.1